MEREGGRTEGREGKGGGGVGERGGGGAVRGGGCGQGEGQVYWLWLGGRLNYCTARDRVFGGLARNVPL